MRAARQEYGSFFRTPEQIGRGSRVIVVAHKGASRTDGLRRFLELPIEI